jgi:hypothetical protein
MKNRKRKANAPAKEPGTLEDSAAEANDPIPYLN